MGNNFTKLTLAAAMALAYTGLQAQDVFKCDFETGTLEGWTVIDNNTVDGEAGKGDGSTWSVYTEYDTGNKVAQYSYSLYNQADDYLVTPAITLKPGTYQIAFDYMGSSYGEKMEVMAGSAPTAEGMTATLADLGTFFNTWQAGVAYYKAEKEETVYFAFHATSDANMYIINVDNVTVSESEGIDAAVTAILSPQTSYDLTATQPVTIKVENRGVADISSMKLYYTVNGGEAVGEEVNTTLAAGGSMEYTFKATADMESTGAYKIEAWVEVEGDAVEGNNKATATVRHRGLATTPYFMGFEADEEIDLIKTFNLNNDDGNWAVNFDDGFWSSFARTGSGCMMYDYDKNNAGDDWFITEGIQMEPGYYSLKFWYSTMGEHNERMLVAYGKEQTPEAMTTQIVSYDPFNTNDAYLESASVVKIEEAGTYYFGFKSFSDKDENIICIDDLSLEAISGDLNDVAVAGITAPEHGYVADNTAKDVVFSVTNKGINTAEGLTVKASIDDKQIYANPIGLEAQQTVEIKIENALDGLEPGQHSLTVEIVNDGDNNPDDNTMTEEFKVMGQCVKCWDAEQGKIDDDLTLLVEDEYTSADEMFPGNEAFTVIELGAHHDIYGDWQYCASSWFIEDDAQANRWLILPKVKVTGENADMMWAAGSYSETYPETYRVRVSTNETMDTGWFTTIETVNNENWVGKSLATRGVSLADYAGQEIYIAFQLITTNGDLLMLDNISLYGDIELSTPSGIDDAKATDGGITVSGGEITAEGAKAISVCDTAGRQLVHSGTGRADISQLNNGVYIVTVTGADGNTDTVKIMKR